MTAEQRPSKKQRELLLFIDTFIKGNGYGPSYREIMRSLDYKSVSTVAVHVNNLIVKGWLRKRDRSARSIEVLFPITEHKAPIVTAASHAEPIGSVGAEWLVEQAEAKVRQLRNHPTSRGIDELYVLTGALHVLGLKAAHESAKKSLLSLEKQLKAKQPA